MTDFTLFEGFRVCFPHLDKPFAHEGGDKEKYSAVLMFDKSNKALLKKLRNAIDEAGKAAFKNRPFNLPIHDGNKRAEKFPEFKDQYYINASNYKYVSAINGRKEIIDPEEIYSGCYVNATLAFYTYDYRGNTGVGVSLNMVQKVRDGERLDEGTNPDNRDKFPEIKMADDDDDYDEID